MSGRSRHPWLGFRSTACGNTREISFRPESLKDEGERRFVTPRQTCPRPEGLGRNLRSKTRWFTGFCNSHQVSHFATFFIDARAEISVAESRFRLYIAAKHPRTHRLRGGECYSRSVACSLTLFVPGFCDIRKQRARPDREFFSTGKVRETTDSAGTKSVTKSALPRVVIFGSRVVLFWTGIDNDPSAGSPTETLLRLLLPLNDKV